MQKSSKKYKLPKEFWQVGKSKFFEERMYQEGLWKRGQNNSATINDLRKHLNIN